MITHMAIGRRTARSIVCAGLILGLWSMSASGDPEPKLSIMDPADGAYVGTRFVVRGRLSGAPAGAVVRVGDGTAIVGADGTFEVPAVVESEGVWTIRVLYGPVGVPALVETRDVTVDTTPPRFDRLLPANETERFDGDEGRVSGLVRDAAPVSLRINGRSIKVGNGGEFESIFVLPAEGDVVVTLEAIDAAGNAATPVVRKLRRAGDLGSPLVIFEPGTAVWISREGQRLRLQGGAQAQLVSRVEWDLGPLGSVGHPATIVIRTEGGTDADLFFSAWKALGEIKGAHLIAAYPPDRATAAVNADVIDLVPASNRSGAWTVRMGVKEWNFSAADVSAILDASESVPASMVRTLDEMEPFLKAARKYPVLRLRFPAPVPYRLLDAVWVLAAKYRRADTILENSISSEQPSATAPGTPTTVPSTPATASTADRQRLEARLASSNSPAAALAAIELADKHAVESIPALRAALARPGSTSVRGAVAKALGRLNDLDSIPALIDLLRNPDGDLAADADMGLSSMSGLGRVVKESMTIEQRTPIADRYARWWRGAETGMRSRAAKSPAAAPSKAAPSARSTDPETPAAPPEVSNLFPSRTDHRLRGRLVDRRGDDCVEDALRWLMAHQSPDGGWECEGWRRWCDRKPSAEGESLDGPGMPFYDVGVTGLALLAFLGAGYTHRSEGPFGKVIDDGLRYLTRVQDGDGCFGDRRSAHYIYNHAIAALAIVEAYGMTGSLPYRAPTQKALDFIGITRNPYFAWRYGVKSGENDTSVTGWMLMVLETAKLINAADVKAGKAATLTYDVEAFDGGKGWIEKMTDPDTGRVGYQMRGTGPARKVEDQDRFPSAQSESMTAVAILSRIHLGENPNNSDVIGKAAALCVALTPSWSERKGTIDMYYWYYGSLALFQVGGAPWKQWEEAMKTAIVDQQHKDTEFCRLKGSWDPIDPWGPDGGRVYSTALMALCIETPYRYERLFPVTRRR